MQTISETFEKPIIIAQFKRLRRKGEILITLSIPMKTINDAKLTNIPQTDVGKFLVLIDPKDGFLTFQPFVASQISIKKVD